MKEQLNNFFLKLKFYLFILFILLSSYFLIINGIKKEKNTIFKKITHKRILTDLTDEFLEESNYIYEANQICSSISHKLEQYYKTGNLEIDIDDITIECPDKDKNYMKALISIVDNILLKIDNSENSNIFNNNTYENFYSDDIDKNKKIYLNRVVSFIIFGVISLISVIGWAGCIVFSYCERFHCSCIKNEFCKVPFCLFLFIPSLLLLCLCIYGLVLTNEISNNLSNTQCSFLKFFEITLYGEEKKQSQTWLGIKGTCNMLKNIDEQIDKLKYANIDSKFDDFKEKVEIKSNKFFFELKNVHKKLYKEDEITPLEGYSIDYSNSTYFTENIQKDITTKSYLNGKYVLDIVPLFGKYNVENNTFNGLISLWNEEIYEIDEKVKNILNNVQISFQNILINNLAQIKKELEIGQNKLKDLILPFKEIYKNQSKRLYEFSKKIYILVDVFLNLIFSLMLLLIISLNVIFLIYIIEYNQKKKPLKLTINIIWNILALFMFSSFLLGSAVGSIGIVGEDLVSVFSFIISPDNFNKTRVFINKFNEGKDILEECILREGNLSRLFELSEYIEDFDMITKGKKEIKNYIEQIKNLEINYPPYNILKLVLENKTEFINDTELYFHYPINEYENITQKISFDEILQRLNKLIGEKHYEQWDIIKGEKSYECYRDKIEGLLPKNIFLHPWTCEPIDRDGVEYANIDIRNYAQIASDIIDLLKYANGTKNPGIEGFHNYFEIINELKEIYSEYLNTYLISLEYFYNITFEIINVLGEDNINNKNTFSFLDGKFIKTNIKIILKYLKYSFGKKIYDLGICLIVIGFFLIFPITSSILLLILLDDKNYKNIKKKKKKI